MKTYLSSTFDPTGSFSRTQLSQRYKTIWLVGKENGFISPGRDYRVICSSRRKRTINGCQIFSVQIFTRVIQLLVHKHTQDTDPPSRNPRFTLHAACWFHNSREYRKWVWREQLVWCNTVSLELLEEYSAGSLTPSIFEIQLGRIDKYTSVK